MTAWKLLTQNLRAHPFSHLLIILLISATTALSIAISLQERALREGSARAADRFDLLIGAPGSETQLVLSTVFLQIAPLSLIDGEKLSEIQHNPLVKWASPVGFGDFYQGRPIIGVSRDLLTDSGRRPSQGQLFTHRNEAVVGARTGLKIGDTFTPMHGEIGGIGSHLHQTFIYRVVGILPEDGSVWDTAILVPIEAVWLLHQSENKRHSAGLKPHPPTDISKAFTAPIGGMANQSTPAIIIKPNSIAAAYQLRQQYKRDKSTIAVFPAEILVKLYSTLGDIKKILTLISLSTQLLVLIAVTHIISITLSQQQHQLAALRAFGAPRGRIFLILWSGHIILMTLALSLGILGGWTLANIASHKLTASQGFRLPVHFTSQDALFITAILITAILALLIPTHSQFRRNPADILRRHD